MYFEKIEAILEEKSMSKIQLKDRTEKYLGEEISRSTWFSYMNGTRNIPRWLMLPISRALEMSMSEVFEVDGEDAEYILDIIKKPSEKVKKIIDTFYVQKSEANIIYLDKLDMRAGAGSAGFIDVPHEGHKVAVDKFIINGLNPKYLKIIEVIGDSMYPEFREGDLAILDMVYGRDTFAKIGGIYVIRVNDVVYIKKVEFLPDGKLKLISINRDYGDMLPHEQGYEYEILAKVCGKIRVEKGLTFDNGGVRWKKE